MSAGVSVEGDLRFLRLSVTFGAGRFVASGRFSTLRRTAFAFFEGALRPGVLRFAMCGLLGDSRSRLIL